MNRRTVAGLCLIASPVLHVVSQFLWPAGSEGSAATQLATAAAHPGAMSLATLIETLGWVLLLPALAVLWSEVRGRGGVLVGIGVWGGVLGILGFAVSGVLNLVTIDLGTTSGGVAAYDAIRHDGRMLLSVLLPIMLGLLSLVVLFAGTARAGLGQWWMPAAALVAVVGDQVVSDSENPLVVSGAFLPMAAALIVLGVRLVSRPVAAPVAAGTPIPATA
jgi:hypothetical protein